MKNLIKDESAVAYLLLVVVGLSIFIIGLAYMFVSDFTDYILSSINSYAGTPLANQMDTDSIATGDLLLTLFKFILIPSLILIMYFAWVMAQKPNKPW